MEDGIWPCNLSPGCNWNFISKDFSILRISCSAQSSRWTLSREKAAAAPLCIFLLSETSKFPQTQPQSALDFQYTHCLANSNKETLIFNTVRLPFLSLELILVCCNNTHTQTEHLGKRKAFWWPIWLFSSGYDDFICLLWGWKQSIHTHTHRFNKPPQGVFAAAESSWLARILLTEVCVLAAAKRHFGKIWNMLLWMCATRNPVLLKKCEAHEGKHAKVQCVHVEL